MNWIQFARVLYFKSRAKLHVVRWYTTRGTVGWLTSGFLRLNFFEFIFLYRMLLTFSRKYLAVKQGRIADMDRTVLCFYFKS